MSRARKAASGPSLPASPPIAGAAPIVLAGGCFLCVAWAFSYLDRRHGGFGVESMLWLGWALLGFGTGARQPAGGPSRATWVVRVMAALGVLAALAGLLMYAMPRWVCFVLLIATAVRAPRLSTERDLHLSLVTIFTVSFMAASHWSANWTLWVYLGPAWCLGCLALAWQHAARGGLSWRITLPLTMAFIGLAFALASVLFLFAPLPPVLGFGFLPPGGDTGLWSSPAGPDGSAGAEAGRGPGGTAGSGGSAGTGSIAGRGGSAGSAASGAGNGGDAWRRMFGRMRADLDGDRTVPAWQRELLEGMISAAEAFERVARLIAMAAPPWWMALVLMLAWYGWRLRRRMAWVAWLVLASALAGWRPAWSLRCTVRAMDACLRGTGHPPGPGQSLREHWLGAPTDSSVARRWMQDAVDRYGAIRFGRSPATRQDARYFYQAVQAVGDIRWGMRASRRARA